MVKARKTFAGTRDKVFCLYYIQFTHSQPPGRRKKCFLHPFQKFLPLTPKVGFVGCINTWEVWAKDRFLGLCSQNSDLGHLGWGPRIYLL